MINVSVSPACKTGYYQLTSGLSTKNSLRIMGCLAALRAGKSEDADGTLLLCNGNKDSERRWVQQINRMQLVFKTFSYQK